MFDDVSEGKKDEKWLERHLVSINTVNTSAEAVKYERTLWNYYNNKPDGKKYDFLRKTGEGHELPVYYYHIPLQRTLVDILVSQHSQRPFNFSVVAVDNQSVEDKYMNLIETYVTTAYEEMTNRTEMISQIEQQIQQKVQEIQDKLQQQPTTPEEQQQFQQLKQMMPMIQQQADQQIKQLEKAKLLTDDMIDQIKREKYTTKKDFKETIAQKTLQYLRKELAIKQKSVEAIKCRFVTGKVRTLVNLEEGIKLPEYRILNPINVTYPLVEGINNICDGPWVKIREKMTVDQIKSNWNEEITKKYGADALDYFEYNAEDITVGTFVSTPGYGAIFTGGVYSPGLSTSGGVTVDYIWIRSQRKQIVKYSPNPYEVGEVFTHFVSPSKEIIKKEDYKYKTVVDENSVKKSYYINKKDHKLIFNEDEVELWSESKKECYKTKYTNDIYHGIVIGGKYVVALGKKQYVCRNIDKHYVAPLPVFGKTFSKITEQPYSIIDATIDLQDLYDVLHMQEQLMIALSGSKGQIIDRSQKPQSMSDELWEYNWKMGRGYIQTTDGNGNPINKAYNQFASFDNTLSPSIQFINNIKEGIKNTMGTVVGIPPQRMAQISNNDQVGTFEMAIQQSSMITEILYYDHDNEELEPLRELLHLTLRYCYTSNNILDLENKDMTREPFMIPANLLNNIQFDLVLLSNLSEEKTLKDLKKFVLEQWKQGQASMKELTDVISEESLAELKAKVLYYDEETKKLAAQARDADQQGKEALIEKQAQLNQQFESEWKQKELEINSKLADIQQQRLQSDSQIAERDLQLREKIAEANSKIQLLDISNKDKQETGILLENKEARQREQKLKELQIKIDDIYEGLHLAVDKHKHELDHHAAMEKIDSDKKMRNKEYLPSKLNN